MKEFSDGLITGYLNNRVQHKCQACGEKVYCIYILRVILPEGIKPLGTFVLYRYAAGELRDQMGSPGQRFVVAVQYIGITCGCYAKAHRQIAHIQHKRRSRK